MYVRKTTRSLAALLLLALLACLLALPGAAAEGDITDRLRDSLRTDTASIQLYTPTERFSSCGEILYSDETGAMTLAISGEDSVPLQSASVSGESVYTPREDGESGETDSWDGSTPYVRSGYVLVTLRAEGRDDYMACLLEEYTLSADERAARRAAAESETAAAAEEETTAEPEGETALEPETEPLPAAASPEPAAETPAPARTGLFDRIGELSGAGVALLIAGMVILAAALAELILLAVYRRRAESVAKNYIRAKAALDKSKRELAAARTKNLRLERELLQERNKMNAVREELERMQEKRAKKDAAPDTTGASAKPKRTKKKSDYDLDYLDWAL